MRAKPREMRFALENDGSVLDCRVFGDSFFDPSPGNFEDIGESLIDKRVGRSTGDNAGDIRHAVMDHAFFDKRWLLMGSWPAGFDRAALIDAHVHDNRAWFHGFHNISRD